MGEIKLARYLDLATPLENFLKKCFLQSSGQNTAKSNLLLMNQQQRDKTDESGIKAVIGFFNLASYFGALSDKTKGYVETEDKQANLMDITKGVGLDEEIIKAMIRKGWEFKFYSDFELVHNADPLSSYFEERIMFTAINKTGLREGSMEWLRELCDVLKYDRSVIRKEWIDQGGIGDNDARIRVYEASMVKEINSLAA
jgi:hypothetical protein